MPYEDVAVVQDAFELSQLAAPFAIRDVPEASADSRNPWQEHSHGVKVASEAAVLGKKKDLFEYNKEHSTTASMATVRVTSTPCRRV